MKSSVPHRGVQDIRTMSERISDADNPQRKYLALAMLELETSPPQQGETKRQPARGQHRPAVGRHHGRADGTAGRRRSGVGCAGLAERHRTAAGRGRRSERFKLDLLIVGARSNN